jgi:uncharacterized protein YigA (DUF484 family)
MNADDIAIFLRSNPKFFDQHPELLEKIHVPHPHGGRAIPLSERQNLALREKVKAHEARLGELLRFGEENDAISEKVHRLSVALVGARDLAALIHSLGFHLREDFAVPHVALRIWGRALPAELDAAQPVDEAQKRAAGAMGAPQCGAAAGNPFAGWFGEAAEHVRSMALVPLGETTVFGLLALGSEDAQRFFPDMGTLYLRRIGELCAAAATARL